MNLTEFLEGLPRRELQELAKAQIPPIKANSKVNTVCLDAFPPIAGC
jgi:hypothetical protein